MQISVQTTLSRWLPKEGEGILEYWLSFNPAAPAFGVPWRFGAQRVVETAKVAEAKSPIKADAEDAEVIAPKSAPEVVAESVVAEPVAEKAVEPEVAAEPAPKPAPVPEPAPAPAVAAAKATPDDLTVIKGIGPKMAEKLNAAGVTTYAQIARWNAAKVAKMDDALGGLPGAIKRADWVGQAKALSAAADA